MARRRGWEWWGSASASASLSGPHLHVIVDWVPREQPRFSPRHSSEDRGKIASFAEAI